MRKKFITVVSLLAVLLLFTQAALADSLSGSGKGRIYASKYGITVSRSASVVFTQEGGYTLNTGSGDSVGTYVTNGDSITLTSSGGRVLKLTWKIKDDTLTMTGKMDVGGYSNVSTRMVVTRQGPKVSSVSCPKVAFGAPSVITVKTNELTKHVKIALLDGTVLAASSTPEKSGVFKFSVVLPAVSNKVTVHAGATENGETVWYGQKSATLSTQAIAKLTKILKAQAASKKVPVGEAVVVTVTANSSTTRVKIVGAQTVESSEYELVGGKRVFSVAYVQSEAKKNQKLKIYSGDDYGYKTTAKTIKVSFVA